MSVPAWVLQQSPEWRFIVAYNDPANASGKSSGTLTFLDRYATNRSVGLAINQPTAASMDVPSDVPEVNILRIGGGNPFVYLNSRFLYGFRREGAFSPNRTPTYPQNYPWVIRYAGILDQVGREAESDQGMTHITAHDPWQYWMSRPVVTDEGLLVGRGGWKLQDAAGNPLRGDQIVVKLLTNALAAHGNLYADFGQTPFYNGTIEHTDLISFSVDQGEYLGEALTRLCDSGNIDIVLDPIYDIQIRPGYLVEVNLYKQAGSINNGAIFAWDLPSRSVVGVDLMDDGTQMANRVALWASSAKNPVPVQSPTIDSAPTFGEWWQMKSLSGTDPSISGLTASAEMLAKAEATLLRQGKRSLTISPAPERSPVPFNEYGLGDLVPFWASRERFGIDVGPGPVGSDGQWTNPQRIYAIPISIGDDTVETIDRLLFTQPSFL